MADACATDACVESQRAEDDVVWDEGEVNENTEDTTRVYVVAAFWMANAGKRTMFFKFFRYEDEEEAQLKAYSIALDHLLSGLKEGEKQEFRTNRSGSYQVMSDGEMLTVSIESKAATDSLVAEGSFGW